MPFVNNNQRRDSGSNAQVGAKFEDIAFEYFKNKENVILDRNYEITLGVELKKKHRFDLGSYAEKIIVECKSHTWTKGNNAPSAKISVWNEAMFYFNIAPKEYKKIFFVLNDYNKKNKTLLRYYFENNYHFISKDILFYEYFTNDGHCEKYNFNQIEEIIREHKNG